MIGVYILRDGDEVVYVGKSDTCLKKRVSAHTYSSKKFNSCELIEIDYSGIFSETDKLERELIFKYQPKYNKQLKNKIKDRLETVPCGKFLKDILYEIKEETEETWEQILNRVAIEAGLITINDINKYNISSYYEDSINE